MILLIGEGKDESMSKYLFNALQDKQANVIWIDQNSLPIENNITMYFEKGRLEGNLHINEELTIDLSEFIGIYSRLASINVNNALNEQEKNYLETERLIALNIWFEHTDALVINRTSTQRSNGSKLYQSWIVQQYGFKIPECILTNNPDKAQKFVQKHKNTGIIYKSASAERSKVVKMTDEDINRLSNLSGCPVLFQSYVPGIDIRVHALATGETFASEICSETSDYRYDAERSIRAIEISDKLKEICVNLTRDLGLYLSGIDIRITPDDQYYCFEVNPSPAFAWYEDQTEQPISIAVANMLMNGKEIVKSNIVKRKF